MDYTNLRDLLAASQWKKADDETARVLLIFAGREAEGWLDTESIAKLPCDDLLTIDQLWKQASQGRFGLGVQKQVWAACGSRVDYPTEQSLGEKLGWYEKNKGWLFGDKLNFSLSAPIGHLPQLGAAKRGILVRWLANAEVTNSALSWKMAACSSANVSELEQPPVQPYSHSQVSRSGTTLTVSVTDPRHPAQDYGQIGNARLEQEQYPEAVTALEKDGLLEYEKGLNLLNSGQYAAALPVFNRAIQSMPGSAKAYHCKGLALGNLGRYTEALAAFEAALQINPTFNEVYRNRDAALYRLGRAEAAVELYTTLLASKPDYDYGHYRKAIVLDELGHYEAALESVNQSIRLNPNFAPAHLSKGIVLDHLGRPQEALQALSESLRLDPQSPQTQNSYRIVLQKLK